jgi:hypothetical protein
VLQRVPDRLHADQAVAEHERVDAVVDPGGSGDSGPFQEQDVVLVDQGAKL